MTFKKDLLLFLIIIATWLAFRFYIIYFLPISNNLSEPIFLTDMLGNGMVLPWQIILFFGLLNLLLFQYLGKLIFSRKLGLLSAAIYAISPWFAYLEVAGSIYIFLLFWILVSFISIERVSRGRNKSGFIFLLLSALVLIYSSFISIFFIPALFLTIRTLNPKRTINLKIFFSIFVILCLPLFWFSFKNLIGLKNVFHNQVKIFADPELLNTPNSFRGESSEEGYFFISKISENKYVYFTKYLILKSVKNLVPSTFFTPQEKLLRFSFSQPIFLGLLIPFIYGLYIISKKDNFKNYLIISILLIGPSLLSKSLVDLNRLVLFSPAIILVISYGLIKLQRVLVFLCLLLLIVQSLVTIFDIAAREPFRLQNANPNTSSIKNE